MLEQYGHLRYEETATPMFSSGAYQHHVPIFDASRLGLAQIRSLATVRRSCLLTALTICTVESSFRTASINFLHFTSLESPQ